MQGVVSGYSAGLWRDTDRCSQSSGCFPSTAQTTHCHLKKIACTQSMRAEKSASSEGVEHIRERGAQGQGSGSRGGTTLVVAASVVQLQMSKYLLGHFEIFNAGNDLHGTAAVLAARWQYRY